MYTKSELLDLRKRLFSELDQIRDLLDRIESGRFNIGETPRSQPKSKKFSGSKRPGPAIGSAPKKLSDGYYNGSLEAVNFGDLLKECEKIVGKLIKHKKFGYDVVAFGLLDYHQIVKHPTDLGTVKANLAKNVYIEIWTMSDKNDDLDKKMKDNEEEDVDIGDDMPAVSFPPVEIEIEKDEGLGGGGGGVGGSGSVGQDHDQDDNGRGNASSSSSSSGSSSSDSSSSSGIDNDSSCDSSRWNPALAGTQRSLGLF